MKTLSNYSLMLWSFANKFDQVKSLPIISKSNGLLFIFHSLKLVTYCTSTYWPLTYCLLWKGFHRQRYIVIYLHDLRWLMIQYFLMTWWCQTWHYQAHALRLVTWFYTITLEKFNLFYNNVIFLFFLFVSIKNRIFGWWSLLSSLKALMALGQHNHGNSMLKFSY